MVDRHRTTGVVKPVQVDRVKTNPVPRIIPFTQSVAPIHEVMETNNENPTTSHASQFPNALGHFQSGITAVENGAQNDQSEPIMEVDVDETTDGDSRRLYWISGAVRYIEDQSEDQWTIEESKYVLDFYEIHMNDIGPLKTFRNKKEMWEKLAIRLHGACDSRKTAAQVSRRFDAMMKKKKEAVNKNKVSGAGRTRVEFQEELDKIAANDDSIDPEVIRGVNFVKYKEVKEDKTSKKPRWDKPTKKGIMQNLSETMLSIEKRKEDRDIERNKQREERHKATMELLAVLVAKKNAP